MLKKYISTVLLLFSVALSLFAQEQQRDSLVVLLSSQSAQAVEIDGVSYRKVIGSARFLHNNTYLLCDTAFWNVDSRYIKALGNVSVQQEETILTGDKLTYLIDEDLAQFRGSLVQLQDKDHNTLRTHNLDYNTKDSLATFFDGGSMRDKDGQIIESKTGYYDSKSKKFTFVDDVNMFTDSIFVKTSHLVYESDRNLATFSSGTNAWKDENMLSSESGWYDRNEELFFFNDKVHILSKDQEGWCDSLYFYRMSNNVDMLNNAQVNDTTRNVFALAGNIFYSDSLSKVTLTRDPAVISLVTEKATQQDGTVKDVQDTVYFGADFMSYYTKRKCDIDSAFVALASERKATLDVDPVSQFRRKAAEEAAREAQEKAKLDPNYRPEIPLGEEKSNDELEQVEEPDKEFMVGEADERLDSLSAPTDTLALTDTLVSKTDSLALNDLEIALTDSLALTDTLAPGPLDTTKIGFLDAVKNVKIFRKSMQVVCDSLVYSDLDSLARMFKEPIIFQEGVRQYAADSISIVIRNESMDKASLISNAFITIQEDSLHHDQIKSTEMMAYFNSDGELIRFDALGGAQALFYIEENDTLATVNKKDCKMMSAIFKDNDIERIYYFDQPKSDAYPLAQMTQEERKLKGFAWQPERRPVDRYAITALELRLGERSRYERVPRARFDNTEKYFPGYIGDIYRQIEVRDSLKVIRDRERKLREEQQARQERLDSLHLSDSLKFIADSLALADSLQVIADSLAKSDSLSRISSAPVVDSLAIKDSIYRSMSPKERRAYDKEEKRLKKEAQMKKKEAMREAKWKELDARDETKRKAKEKKRLEKERAIKRKALKEIAEQRARDQRVYENYLKKYKKQVERDKKKELLRKEKELRKTAKKPQKEDVFLINESSGGDSNN